MLGQHKSGTTPITNIIILRNTHLCLTRFGNEFLLTCMSIFIMSLHMSHSTESLLTSGNGTFEPCLQMCSIYMTLYLIWTTIISTTRTHVTPRKLSMIIT